MSSVEAVQIVSPEITDVARGETCPGVNRVVLKDLLERFGQRDLTILDIACGSGVFLDAVSQYMPEAVTYGCDITDVVNTTSRYAFLPTDLEIESKRFADGPFDAITCISGIMEFDNTLMFLKRVRESIREDGIFLVTNDNLLTVRDRLMYLLQGRFGQYPFDVKPASSTWKILPLQNLIRLVDQAGFTLVSISYTEPTAADWLWLPFALPLFILQRLSVRALSAYFPLRGLLSRHYVLACKPRSADA